MFLFNNRHQHIKIDRVGYYKHIYQFFYFICCLPIDVVLSFANQLTMKE